MIKAIYKIVLLLFVLTPFISQAQEIKKKEPDLVTDRPDQTESSITIPLRHLQIEAGFIFEQANPEEKNIYYNTTLLRFGLLRWFEVRMGMDYAGIEQKDTITDKFFTNSGFSPLSLGGKIQVMHGDGWIPEIAILAHVTVPNTGNEEFIVNCFRPSLRAAISHSASDRISIGYNLALERDCVNELFLGAYTLVIGLRIVENLGGYIETYGFTTETHKLDMRMDAGITWLLRKNFQVDLSGGIGLNSIAPDAFIGFGISWRIPR
jgi:hypothetical protein